MKACSELAELAPCPKRPLTGVFARLALCQRNFTLCVQSEDVFRRLCKANTATGERVREALSERSSDRRWLVTR